MRRQRDESVGRRLLRRFLERFRSGAIISEAGADDLDTCVTLAAAGVIEKGLAVASPGLIEALRESLSPLIGGVHMAVLLVHLHREPVGMICCAMVTPSPWDRRPTMGAWLAYVLPRYRQQPAAVVSLLRAAVERGDRWGAKRLRFNVDAADEHLTAQYEALLGFEREATQHTYGLDWGS